MKNILYDQLLNDEREQAIKRGGQFYAEIFIEGVKEGYTLAGITLDEKYKNDICACGVKYKEIKKSDIPYSTNDNVYFTDIIIIHCPKCGDIKEIKAF